MIKKIGTGGIGKSQASHYPGAMMGIAFLGIDGKRPLISLDGMLTALQIVALFEYLKVDIADLPEYIALLGNIHLEGQHPFACL